MGYSITINGSRLEDVVAGFHSFEVKGRNVIAPDITTNTVGNRDGDVYQRKRFGGRTLSISYALIADSPAALKQKFRQLNALLDVEECQIVFGDEPDVFYIGTLSEIDEPDGATNAMSGTMQFYCCDPFKYSVEEFTAETQTIDEQQAFVINYSGTMPSRPTITANVAADLGYMAFANNDAQIIQLGDPDEEEGNSSPSETLINSSFKTSTQSATWASTTGGTAAKLPSNSWEQTGSVKNSNSRLEVNSYGSTTTAKSAVHGVAVKAQLPADSSGAIGAVRCKYEFKYIFQSSKTSQAGKLVFGIQTASKLIAAIHLYKGKDSKTAYAYLIVNGSQKKKLSFTAGKKNAYTQATASITKADGKITFVIGGKTYSYTDSAIASEVITAANIYFGRHKYKKTSTTYADAAAMNGIGVYSAKIIKNHVEAWRDIPNKFASGDEVVVDCSSGLITVNGNAADELGALGNDWETFALDQGANYIVCAYSEWTQTPPTFALKYRKVYL